MILKCILYSTEQTIAYLQTHITIYIDTQQIRKKNYNTNTNTYGSLMYLYLYWMNGYRYCTHEYNTICANLKHFVVHWSWRWHRYHQTIKPYFPNKILFYVGYVVIAVGFYNVWNVYFIYWINKNWKYGMQFEWYPNVESAICKCCENLSTICWYSLSLFRFPYLLPWNTLNLSLFFIFYFFL